MNEFQFSFVLRQEASPITINRHLALVSTTLMRCLSVRKSPRPFSFDRTVDTIIIGFSLPWNFSAEPIVTASSPKYLQRCSILSHCSLYGEVTPMSDCPMIRPLKVQLHNFCMYCITMLTSCTLYRLKFFLDKYNIGNNYVTQYLLNKKSSIT